ncbi:MAG: hypothetical protein HRT57_03425 [Crocinitomicaceae bacterium]|nr:hypothetical protein [Crocinitomicaceae bacterium]
MRTLILALSFFVASSIQAQNELVTVGNIGSGLYVGQVPAANFSTHNFVGETLEINAPGPCETHYIW